MWVRNAPVPCAKAQRSAKSMRFRTSSADQFASRSAITALRAPKCVPSGFCARRQICPLSMCVWISTKRGEHDAVVEIEARQAVLDRRADFGDAAVIDYDVAGREAVRVLA